MRDRPETALKIRGLRAGYGTREILSGVDLDIRRGEVAALLGLNGSGKSTLLRAALGFLPVSGGSVTADGENVFALSERARAGKMGYIPQRSRMDEGLSVLDAVLMGANAKTPFLAGYSAAQRARARDYLAQLGMSGYENRMIGTLSQGQRQLAVFARTMMQQPGVLLLDEPDSALDLPRRYEIMAHVRRMAENGAGALCVLHDASLALNTCDRVLILRGGRIVCALEMESACEEAVRSAMALLYGGVKVGQIDGGWAVLGGRSRSGDTYIG